MRLTLDRWVWLLVGFALFYFAGHLVAYGLRPDGPRTARYVTRGERVAYCINAGYSSAECVAAHDDNGDR